MKPYNEKQIDKLVRYAKQFSISQFTLHAYVAQDGAKTDDGYTKAYNADVAEQTVLEGVEGLGDCIEDLVAKYKTDVTISSKVKVRHDKGDFHIPMLDFSLPYVPFKHQSEPGDLLCDVNRFMTNSEQGKSGFSGYFIGTPSVWVSGHSFHAYCLNEQPIAADQFQKFCGAVLVCDHDHVADHAWLGFSLGRGEFRLRLTAVQKKYTQLPTFVSEMNEQKLRIENDVRRVNAALEDIPF